MRKIIVEIPCGDQFCDRCAIRDGYEGWCPAFDVMLKSHPDEMFNFCRCDECKAAELPEWVYRQAIAMLKAREEGE